MKDVRIPVKKIDLSLLLYEILKISSIFFQQWDNMDKLGEISWCFSNLEVFSCLLFIPSIICIDGDQYSFLVHRVRVMREENFMARQSTCLEAQRVFL